MKTTDYKVVLVNPNKSETCLESFTKEYVHYEYLPPNGVVKLQCDHVFYKTIMIQPTRPSTKTCARG